MTIYNVAATVVDLIEADDDRQARQRLDNRLRRSGFEVIEGDHEVLVAEDQEAIRGVLDEEGLADAE